MENFYLDYLSALKELKGLASIYKNKLAIKNLETVPLVKALGRISAKNLFSSYDRPSFNRVLMDGFGVNREEFLNDCHPINLSELKTVKAGDLESQKGSGPVIKVMTGSIAPQYIDLVIKKEDKYLLEDPQNYKDLIKKYLPNIAPKGSETKKGDLLIEAGTLIKKGHLGILAENNYKDVLVIKKLQLKILSSGNEIVPLGTEPEEGQIIDSNSYSILAQIKSSIHCQNNFDINLEGNIADTLNGTKEKIELLFKDETDILIVSGGISMGDFDFIPQSLKDLGFIFYVEKIKQCPGKPLIIAYREIDNKIVIALPGNGVSSFVCMENSVLPLLKEIINQDKKINYLSESEILQTINLSESLSNHDERTFWRPLIKHNNSNEYYIIKEYKTSGHIDSLRNADALLYLPPHSNEVTSFKGILL